jgi:hypothetical protein
MSDLNPANSSARKVDDATRIPMSLPRLMLEVPGIEGYVLHWFADRPGRVSRALQGGYEFVSPEEVQLNNFGFANDMMADGNTDLGSRISVHGGTSDTGGAERLYLMKIRQEWYDKDMALREQATDRVVSALRAGDVGAEKAPANRYAKNTDNLFTRNKRSR